MTIKAPRASPRGRGARPGLLAASLVLLAAAAGCSQPQNGQVPPPSIEGVAFAPGGKVLAAAVSDTVKLWDAETGQERLTLRAPGTVTCLAFSPDGRRIATGGFDKKVRLWDADTGQELFTLEGHQVPVTCVAFSPDGDTLASGGGDPNPFGRIKAEARLWDAAAGKHRADLAEKRPDPPQEDAAKGPPAGMRRGPPGGDQGAQAGPVRAVAFTPDGKSLAVASLDGSVRVWDVAAAREQAALPRHERGALAVAFAPDGRTLAVAAGDGTIKLFDADGWKERATLQGHGDRVTSVAFAPDGGVLASGSEDNTARLWDPAAGQPRSTLEGHTRPVTGVAFGAGGSALATGSLDGTVRLWDTAGGKEQKTFK